VQQLRIHAIPLADDDGKRKYTFTLDNLEKGVIRANKALAHADVELVFDPKGMSATRGPRFRLQRPRRAA
jgi:hypothetical protein